MTIEEYRHQQLEHKRVPRDIDFLGELGQQVRYKISHEDTAAKSCNDFYPIHYQEGEDQKILGLHNFRIFFSVFSINTEFITPSVQLAAESFRMGKSINQFHWLCTSPSPASLSLTENSIGNYSSISVVEAADTKESGPSSRAKQSPCENDNDDRDEDVYICVINANDR